jgi:hypothetical protein
MVDLQSFDAAADGADAVAPACVVADLFARPACPDLASHIKPCSRSSRSASAR